MAIEGQSQRIRILHACARPAAFGPRRIARRIHPASPRLSRERRNAARAAAPHHRTGTNLKSTGLLSVKRVGSGMSLPVATSRRNTITLSLS